MATAKDLTEIALSLEGTTAAPHMDRTAFKVQRIYATLASDGKTANLKLLPDEQQLKYLTHPAAFAPVNGGWGWQGWTTMTLAELNSGEMANALKMAWVHGAAKKPAR